jgi:hypothetical protein
VNDSPKRANKTPKKPTSRAPSSPASARDRRASVAPSPSRPPVVAFEFPIADDYHFRDAAARRSQAKIKNSVIDRHIAQLASAVTDLLAELPTRSASRALSRKLEALYTEAFRVQGIVKFERKADTPLTPAPKPPR